MEELIMIVRELSIENTAVATFLVFTIIVIIMTIGVIMWTISIEGVVIMLGTIVLSYYIARRILK